MSGWRPPWPAARGGGQGASECGSETHRADRPHSGDGRGARKNPSRGRDRRRANLPPQHRQPVSAGALQYPHLRLLSGLGVLFGQDLALELEFTHRCDFSEGSGRHRAGVT